VPLGHRRHQRAERPARRLNGPERPGHGGGQRGEGARIGHAAHRQADAGLEAAHRRLGGRTKGAVHAEAPAVEAEPFLDPAHVRSTVAASPHGWRLKFFFHGPSPAGACEPFQHKHGENTIPRPAFL